MTCRGRWRHGLILAWGDVLNPARRVPKWSYEQSKAPSLLRRMIQVLATIPRMLWAPGFWRAMRMEFVFRPDRLLYLAIVAMLLPWLAYVMCYPAWVWFVDPNGMGGGSWSKSVNSYTVTRLIWPRTLLGVFEPRGWLNWITEFPFAAWLIMLGGALVGPCFVLLPQSLRRAKVRSMHVVRVAMYGLPIMVVLCSIPWIVQDALESLGLLSWRYRALQGLDTWHWQLAWGKWKWVVFAVIAWAWQVWWWRFAVTRYLKLPHGSVLSVLLVVLANLIAIGIMFTMLGSYRMSLINDLFW